MKPAFLLWGISLGLSATVRSDYHADIATARAEMTQAAQAFLGTMGPDLRARALFSFEDENRYYWHYVPRRRKGISLKELNPAQRDAAMSLLQKTLSSKGYQKANGVVILEGVLREFEGSWRDPDLYFISIFGPPSAAEPWGWRLEGHHLSLNFTSTSGEVVATTPAFYGSNPARVLSGPKKDLRVLKLEEDLGRELLLMLDVSQRKKAIISARAPSDIISGAKREIDLQKPEGLSVAEMLPDQRALLMRLVEEYVGNVRPEFADAAMARVGKAGIEEIHFSWAGGEKEGVGHYYRIHGPTLLIEFDNTQNGANHIHSVWRDLEHDFGDDLLRRHYRESH